MLANNESSTRDYINAYFETVETETKDQTHLDRLDIQFTTAEITSLLEVL